MCNTDRNAYFVSQLLQILFENVVASVVTAATIAQQEQFGCLRIIKASIGQPPQPQAGTSEFRCIVRPKYPSINKRIE